MAYADLISNEGIAQAFLVKLQPRNQTTGFTLVSGAIYSASFTLGKVNEVTDDNVTLTEVFTSSLSPGEFYYDISNEVLYVRLSDNTNPSDSLIISTYEINVSDVGTHFFRIPTDNSTQEIFWDALVATSPRIKSSASDDIFGFNPEQSSSISLINATLFWNIHVYDNSFNQAKIEVWHALAPASRAFFEYETDNVKLVYSGVMGDVTYRDNTVSIATFSRADIFNQEFRHSTDDSENFFSFDTFPSLDPRFEGNPIRQIYGFVENIKPVNIDYVAEENGVTPTTSDNRDWVVMSGQTDLQTDGQNVANAVTTTGHTTTQTFVTDVSAFNVGDTVFLITSLTGFIINGFSGNSLLHDALGSPALDGEQVYREFVSAVTIIQDETKYRAILGRDYNRRIDYAGNASGFSFTTSLESNLSMPRTLSPNDEVYCSVYGKVNTLQIQGGAFGGDDTEIDNLTNPIVILYDILRNKAGLPESDFNTQSWITAESEYTEAYGLSIPQERTNSFPTYKELIIDFISSSLFRLYLDDDLKWTIERIAPYIINDKSIDESEIINLNGLTYDFDYRDIYSNFTVEYSFKEVADQISEFSASTEKVTKISEIAKQLHLVNRTFTRNSYHFREADAQKLADRLSYILGDRRGKITLRTKNRFFDTLLQDVIEVNRERLPGFEYVPDTVRTRNFVTVETAKGLEDVTLELDDHKGIQDNSTEWDL